MPKIIPARADQDYISRVHGVAASQTIVEGDPVKIAAGLISKAASADTAIYGFAAHSITTDASGNTVPSYTSGSYAAPADGFSAPDRGLLVYVAQAGQRFAGELLTALGNGTLAQEQTAVGFLTESGFTKIDPSQTNKPFKIVKVRGSYNGLTNIVEFSVLAANRVED